MGDTASQLEQSEILDLARKLVKSHVAPRAEAIDETDEFPWDIKDAFARAGFFGLIIPEAYGGLGFDIATLCAVSTEISKVSPLIPILLSSPFAITLPLMNAGTEEQRKKYLPRMAQGDILVAAGVTEPEAGSDIAALSTTAVRKGDVFVLNGQKRFITNAGVAGLYMIYAKTNPSAGMKGISAFLVEKGTKGLSFGQKEKLMGIRGGSTADIFLDHCEVPVENLVGPENQGIQILFTTLAWGRCSVAAQAIGIAEGAMEYAKQHLKQRVQFGQPLAQFQGLQFMVADAETKIMAAKTLLSHTMEAVKNNRPELRVLLSMAKIFASDMAMEVTTNAVQLLGGYGYTRGSVVERLMRDAKITQIYEGPNQTLRWALAKDLLK